MDRIRFAIKATEQFASYPQQLQEAGFNCWMRLTGWNRQIATSKCAFGSYPSSDVGTGCGILWMGRGATAAMEPGMSTVVASTFSEGLPSKHEVLNVALNGTAFDDFGLLTLAAVAKLLHCSKGHVSRM